MGPCLKSVCRMAGVRPATSTGMPHPVALGISGRLEDNSSTGVFCFEGALHLPSMVGTLGMRLTGRICSVQVQCVVQAGSTNQFTGFFCILLIWVSSDVKYLLTCCFRARRFRSSVGASREVVQRTVAHQLERRFQMACLLTVFPSDLEKTYPVSSLVLCSTKWSVFFLFCGE